MALTHETLHIYKSFHFYKRDPTDARCSHVPIVSPRKDDVSPGYVSRVLSRECLFFFFSSSVSSVIDCCLLREGRKRPRARKRRGAFSCVYIYIYIHFFRPLFFSFLFFSPLTHFTTLRDSGGLRPPELLNHSRFMCTPIASRSETRQRLPHS